jgi:hypothetical protein
MNTGGRKDEIGEAGRGCAWPELEDFALRLDDALLEILVEDAGGGKETV